MAAAASPRSLALVTGASGGIGAEFAKQLAPDFDLMLAARSEPKLEAVAAALSSTGAQIEVLSADLSTAEGVDAVLRRVGTSGRSIELLVNNAGSGKHSPFLDTTEQDLVDLVDLDVIAVTRLTRALLPGMVERGRGGIITMASTSAFQPTPGLAAYAAAKAFVLSLSGALDVETRGTGVTITAVAPGTVATGFFDAAGARFEAGGMLTAEVVVRDALHGYRSGKSLVVPGGRNKLGMIAPRIMPRRLMARMAGRVVRAR